MGNLFLLLHKKLLIKFMADYKIHIVSIPYCLFFKKMNSRAKPKAILDLFYCHFKHIYHDRRVSYYF